MRGDKDELFKRLRDLGLPSCKKAIQDRGIELTRMKHNEKGEVGMHDLPRPSNSTAARQAVEKRYGALGQGRPMARGGVLTFDVPRQNDDKRLKLHTKLVDELETVMGSLNFERRCDMEEAVLQGCITDEKALEWAEEMMYRHEPFHMTIRFFCLISIVFDGVKVPPRPQIPPAEKNRNTSAAPLSLRLRLSSLDHDGRRLTRHPQGHDKYSTELVNCYGPEYLLALKTLERIGLWKSKVDEEAGIGQAAIAVAHAALRGGKAAAKPPAIGAEWEAAKRCLDLVVPDQDMGETPPHAHAQRVYQVSVLTLWQRYFMRG